jgi:transposase
MMSEQIRQVILTKAELKDLRRRIRQSKERRTADRLRVIMFKAEGYTHREIAYLLQMSVNVVTQCLQRYRAGDFDAVCRTNYQGKKVG